VSALVEDFVGANNNSTVSTSPTNHNMCNQRGGGLRAVGGCGGSFGGPDFAGLDIYEAPCCSVTED
jgi:hypothetical protein